MRDQKRLPEPGAFVSAGLCNPDRVPESDSATKRTYAETARGGKCQQQRDCSTDAQSSRRRDTCPPEDTQPPLNGGHGSAQGSQKLSTSAETLCYCRMSTKSIVKTSSQAVRCGHLRWPLLATLNRMTAVTAVPPLPRPLTGAARLPLTSDNVVCQTLAGSTQHNARHGP